MYVESAESNKVGIIAKQQAEVIAEAIEKDREKGREFLRQMGEDDSDNAVDAFIAEHRGK